MGPAAALKPTTNWPAGGRAENYHRKWKFVGPGRIEPPTLRFSVACHQLSYPGIWRKQVRAKAKRAYVSLLGCRPARNRPLPLRRVLERDRFPEPVEETRSCTREQRAGIRPVSLPHKGQPLSGLAGIRKLCISASKPASSLVAPFYVKGRVGLISPYAAATAATAIQCASAQAAFARRRR